MIYIEGLRLLDESDKNVNWNLIDGTSQKFQTLTIKKGNFYNQESQCTHVFEFPVTYSAFVVNNGDQDIQFHMNNNGPDDSLSNIIKAHSKGEIVVNNSRMDGGYFQTTGRSAVSSDLNFQIAELKIERGSIATPWVPSLNDLNLVSRSDLDSLKSATQPGNGPDGYDLHSETESKILTFRANAMTTLNRPATFNSNYATYIRIASSDNIENQNWGSSFWIDHQNNKIYMASDYANKWSEWKEL